MLACGARSGLPVDFDSGAVVDAESMPDAVSPRDASVQDAALTACPTPPRVSFRVSPLGNLEVAGNDVMLPRNSSISLDGDGDVLYLAVASRDSNTQFRVFRLSGRDVIAEEVHTSERAVWGRVSVVDGVARVISYRGGTSLWVVEISADGATVSGTTEIQHISRMSMMRPRWNGDEMVVAGDTGFVGPWRPGDESETWFPAMGVVGLASDPDSGMTRFVDASSPPRFYELDRAGRVVQSTELDTPELWGNRRFGWTDHRWPIVIASVTRGEDFAFRVGVQSFAVDGSRRVGFSAPVQAGFGDLDLDLSTVPIRPSTHGYGAVFQDVEEMIFHGATESFVGDAQHVPGVCFTPQVAAGPCGYVLACQTEDLTIRLWLAVPSRP